VTHGNREPSEIEALKKHREDEPNLSIEANGAQKGELGELKDEIWALQAREDQLLEEVGELKEEIHSAAESSFLRLRSREGGSLCPTGSLRARP
jgi:predicted  nucleic acid-binding Zn-ribbon protein